MKRHASRSHPVAPLALTLWLCGSGGCASERFGSAPDLLLEGGGAVEAGQVSGPTADANPPPPFATGGSRSLDRWDGV